MLFLVILALVGRNGNRKCKKKIFRKNNPTIYIIKTGFKCIIKTLQLFAAKNLGTSSFRTCVVVG